jgi:integrase/recombinase XerD
VWRKLVVFFYKRIVPNTFIVPSNLYPKKQFILPEIMSEAQVNTLLSAPLTLREKCIVGLLYGSGMRISELCNLQFTHIERADKRIKIVQGKGAKDRYTLLPMMLLETMKAYYLQTGLLSNYFFTSPFTKKQFCVRTLQTDVNSAMVKAGFESGRFTAHTLRHSFATHLLNNGSNIHTIKTLLGHSSIETTTIYLHLQNHIQLGIISPLDALMNANN